MSCTISAQHLLSRGPQLHRHAQPAQAPPPALGLTFRAKLRPLARRAKASLPQDCPPLPVHLSCQSGVRAGRAPCCTWVKTVWCPRPRTAGRGTWSSQQRSSPAAARSQAPPAVPAAHQVHRNTPWEEALALRQGLQESILAECVLLQCRWSLWSSRDWREGGVCICRPAQRKDRNTLWAGLTADTDPGENPGHGRELKV